MKTKIIAKKIKKLFQLDDLKTTIKKEIIGGFTTFLAMAYILAVQPAMMSGHPVNLDYGGIYLSTIISSFFATFLMGLFANIPVSLAPGMGINAFFAFTVCGVLKIDVGTALSVVLISGWLYFIIAVTPAKEYIGKVFSKNLKLAIGASIGIFIGFVGLQDTGIIQSDASIIPKDTIISPTSVQLGNLKNPLVLLSIFVLFLMISLYFLKIKGGIIISMFVGIIIMSIMYLAGIEALQGKNGPFKINDFNEQFNGFANISGKSFQNIGKAFSNPLCYIAIFVFLYSDFFDTTGSLFALDQSAGFSKRDPEQKWLKKANIIDATGTIFGASIGSTTVTTFIESQAGISAGAKTGLSSVFTSFMFLLCIFLYPIISPLMPIANTVVQNGFQKSHISPITGPALVIIGILMLTQLKDFDWKKTIDIPVLFMTMLFTTLTYSIASGIAIGIITFVVLNFVIETKEWIVDKYNFNPKFNSLDTGIFSKPNKKTNLKKTKHFEKLNYVLLILFILALVYFGTTILYLDY